MDEEETLPGPVEVIDPRVSPLLVMPERLGHFRVLGTVGAGSMGVVYEAIDEDLGRRVALKLVAPSRSTRHGQRRLLREAQAMARLAHPNTVGVYEVGFVDELLFIAMEFVEGETLEDWLREPRAWEPIVRVFCEAGRGVAAAHEVGLIHRDFKPANVLVGRDGRVRVADFGLSRMVGDELGAGRGPGGSGGGPSDEQARSITRTAAGVGTPAYMAPELFEGREADVLSDQYSFCVALYEVLNGRRPSGAGDRERTGKEEVAAPVRGVPSWVQAALARGLGPREERWPSMEALLRALSIDAHRRRRRAWMIAGSLVAALGVVGVGWQQTRPRLCATGESALTEVWGPQARAELRAKIEGLGRDTSEVSADRILSRLDTYALALGAAERDACEDTRVRGQFSTRIMDARMRCLAGQGREFEALVRVLGADLDVALARRAVAAVAGLPRPERCADLEYISAGVSPPADPATALRVKSAREQLERAQALQRGGRFREALGVTEGLSEVVAVLDYTPLEADFELRSGLLLRDTGAAPEARAALERAYYAAERAGAFRVAQTAAIALVHVVGFQIESASEAEVWVQLASAKVEFHGDLDGRVQLEIGRGEMFEAARDGEAALAAYEAALALHLRGSEPSALRHAEILDNIGSAYMGLTQYALAEPKLEAALAIWEAELGPGHPAVGRGYNSLATLAFMTGGYAEACVGWGRTLAIFEATKGRDSDDVAAILSNLGVTYRRDGDEVQARAHFERAIAIRESALGPDSPRLASVLTNLSNLEREVGRYGVARGLYLRALGILSAQYGENDIRLANPLYGLGALELEENHPARAREVLERALAIRERHGPKADPNLVSTLDVLVEVSLALGEVAVARAYLDRSLAIGEMLPAADLAHCRTQLQLAQVVWVERRDPEQARELGELARTRCRALDGENQVQRSKIDRWLATLPGVPTPPAP